MNSLKAVALLAITLLLFERAAHAAPLRAAVFPFEMDDTSLQGSMQGPEAADQARIARLTTQLSDLLARSGQYQPVTAAAPTDAAMRSCGGCDVDLARKLGARVSVIGWVQKVSNLILNINIVVRDVATDRMIHAGSVDIRGDTDESWSRGLAYLVQNRILVPAEPAK